MFLLKKEIGLVLRLFGNLGIGTSASALALQKFYIYLTHFFGKNRILYPIRFNILPCAASGQYIWSFKFRAFLLSVAQICTF